MSFTLSKNIRFQRSLSLLGKTFYKRHVYAACLNRKDAESYCRAACVLELLTVNRDILYISDNFLNNRSKDINDIVV